MGKLLLLTLNKQKEKAIDKIILGAGYKFDVKIERFSAEVIGNSGKGDIQMYDVIV